MSLVLTVHSTRRFVENVALESLRWVDSELTTLCKTPLAMNEFHSKVVGGQKSQPKTVSTKGFTMTIISSELVFGNKVALSDYLVQG